MRRLALLFAGGALWILISAAPALADGGPHRLTLNNGTSGLAGDCAACHRAHTAQAADLLREEVPGLCLNCHDGTGATADVVDGYQFTPDGNGDPQPPILGALRGGGFTYALVDTGDASRLTYASRGAIILTYGAAPAAGSMTLHFDAFTAANGHSFAGGDLTFTANDTATNIQTAVNTLFGTSTTYTTSGTPAIYMSGTTTNLMSVSVTPTATNPAFTVQFTPKNEFALVPSIPLPTVTSNGSGTTAVPTSTILANAGNTSHVGVLTTGGGALGTPAAVTSTHLGAGTVWGNGTQGQGNVGATGVVLSCTNCHNPHGNGQYRILDTSPGEDWKNGANLASTTLTTDLTIATDPIHVASTAGFPKVSFYITVDSETMLVTAGQNGLDWTVTRGALGTTAAAHTNGAAVNMVTSDWTAPTNDVEVVDGPALTGNQVHNYTIKPGYLTTNLTGANTLGDYFRYKFDPTGTSNFTNFYLIQDPMNTGWNGTSPTNALAVGTATTTLGSALGGTGQDTTALVASLAGMASDASPANPQPVFIIKIDNELMTASFKVDATGPSPVFVANSLTIGRGYNGTSRVGHASGATVTVVSSDPAVGGANAQLYNNFGRMTAWCITCHTRYNGWSQGGNTSSLVSQTPTDSVFMFKHGTTRIGCEQCHVNHGTNAVMSAQFSSQYTYADGTSEDSALLKVNNRGTCNLCHDPTHTVKPGTPVGTVPPNLNTAF